jgi:hypothetical protein
MTANMTLLMSCCDVTVECVIDSATVPEDEDGTASGSVAGGGEVVLSFRFVNP